jgi:hypothetical protein
MAANGRWKEFWGTAGGVAGWLVGIWNVGRANFAVYSVGWSLGDSIGIAWRMLIYLDI